MTHHDHNVLSAQLNSLITRARQPEHVTIGTLIDRHTVKMRQCGGHKADSILACARAIRRAAQDNALFARMGRAIRRDGTIDLWIVHPEDRWRTAMFTLELHTMFRPDDLMLVVSTYVPFGLDGDDSNYPIEQSTAYKRGTQELRAVIELQAKRTTRRTDQSTDTHESGDTSTNATEVLGRYRTEQSGSIAERRAVNWNQSHESGHVHRPNVFGGEWRPDERTETKRGSNGSEYTNEERRESAWVSGQEHNVSDRSERESNSRSTSSSGNETVMEVTQDVSFVAVGPDLTDIERLWSIWRSHPANAEIGTAIELMLSSVGSLGEVVEESIVATRRQARDGHAAIHGDSLSDAFWQEARTVLPVDLDGGQWSRSIQAHDGYPAAIDHRDMEAALRQAQGQIGSTVDSARRFLEGS